MVFLNKYYYVTCILSERKRTVTMFATNECKTSYVANVVNWTSRQRVMPVLSTVRSRFPHKCILTRSVFYCPAEFCQSTLAESAEEPDRLRKQLVGEATSPRPPCRSETGTAMTQNAFIVIQREMNRGDYPHRATCLEATGPPSPACVHPIHRLESPTGHRFPCLSPGFNVWQRPDLELSAVA